MKPFETVDATFRPRRTDDLKPGVSDWIGRRIRLRAAWIIETGENQFAGQVAMEVVDRAFPYVWVPSSDLVDVVTIEPGLSGSWDVPLAQDLPS